MPTYQYLCDSCKHQFEVFQSMSEDPVDKCPECGAKPRRLITGGAGFIFKGSGFYETDYRSSSYKQAASKDSSDSAVSSASSSSDSKTTKSDDKPKSKSDK